MVRLLFSVLAALCGLAVPVFADAQVQPWPTQVVKIVVPFTPGTGMDILARTLGPKLGEMWGQPVIVENKPGASGNLGTYQVVKSPPDGHTLMMGASTLVINMAMYANMQFNPLTDLSPVGLAANASMLLVVHPKLCLASAK